MSAKKLKIPNFRPEYCHFNWLLKLVLKLKTIFVLWVLVSTFPKPFRVTFNRWKNEMLDTFYIAFKYTIAIKGKVNLNFEQVISTKQFRFNFIYSYMSQRRECVTKVVPKICHSQIDFPSYFSCTDSIFIFPS